MHLPEYAAAWTVYKESLSLRREMGDKQRLAFTLLGLDLVALAENRAEAGKHILDSLCLRVGMGEPVQQISSLVGVAGLALHEGKTRQLAQWLGAVAASLAAPN